MPQPRRFQSVEELEHALVSPETRAAVTAHLQLAPWSLATIAHRAVDNSTTRALHTVRYDVHPLAAYRAWAAEHLASHASNYLRAADQDAFDGAVAAGARALVKRFSDMTRGGYSLTFGRAAKMLNLTLKHLPLLEGIDGGERDVLWGRLHVPLDKYSLQGIAPIAPRALRIPPNASMGDVADERQYGDIQAWLGEVCASPGVPRITYDLLAFNSAHAPAKDGPRDGRHEPPSRGRIARPHQPRPIAAPADREALHTDRYAEVVEFRPVERRPALRFQCATLRNATFGPGVLELDCFTSELPTHGGMYPCRLVWYDFLPQRGWAAVKASGCTVEPDYTGEVIARLGRR